MSDREPIVSAVLADPVVKAVLSDPAAAPAVAAVTGQEVLAPVVPVTPVSPPTIVELGSKTTKTIAGTVTTAEGQVVASPTTTQEEERVSQGQRTVNMIWENTQMRIALSVVGTVMLANLIVVVGIMFVLVSRWRTLDAVTIAVLVAVLTGALGSLTSMGSLVIGFYFGRTNHQKIGGVEQGR